MVQACVKNPAARWKNSVGASEWPACICRAGRKSRSPRSYRSAKRPSAAISSTSVPTGDGPTVRDFDLLQTVELQKLDRLEARSLGSLGAFPKTLRSRRGSRAATSEQDSERLIKNQVGEPRFLEQVHKCSARKGPVGTRCSDPHRVVGHAASAFDRRAAPYAHPGDRPRSGTRTTHHGGK